jgi:predicted membrane protein
MDPERPDDTARDYAKRLEDRIVRDARARTSSWRDSSGPPDPDFRITPRFVIGIAIMLAGLVMALDGLGLVDGSAILRFWPLALVAVGIVKWISDPERVAPAVLWIAAGLGFLLVSFGRMSFGVLWALLLFFAGASIAWRALRPRSLPGDRNEPGRLDVVAVLGGGKRRNSSSDFRGGSLLAVMGGWEIDLREASIGGGLAVIDIFVLMGGGQIRVPEDWNVQISILPLMGGVDDKTRTAPGSNKTLRITGVAMMGGVEVRN